MEEEQRRFDEQQALAEQRQAFEERQAQEEAAYRKQALDEQVRQFNVTDARERQRIVNDWWTSNVQLGQNAVSITHGMQVDWAKVQQAGVALQQAQEQFEHAKTMDWNRLGLDTRKTYSDLMTAQYARLGMWLDAMGTNLRNQFDAQSMPGRLEALNLANAVGGLKLKYEELRAPFFAELVKAEVESAQAQARELSARADLTQAQKTEILGSLDVDIAYKRSMIQKLESGDQVTAGEAVREIMARRMMQSPEFRAETAGLGDREELEKTRVQLRSEKRSMESSVYKALKEAGITDIAITEVDGKPVFVRTSADGKQQVLSIEDLNSDLISRQAPEVAPLIEEYLDMQEQYRGANERVYEFDQRARALGINFPGMSAGAPKPSGAAASGAFAGAAASGKKTYQSGIPAGTALFHRSGKKWFVVGNDPIRGVQVKDSTMPGLSQWLPFSEIEKEWRVAR
jgi:hypothetical protein